MNPRDTPNDPFEEAFRARLEAMPEPSAAMFARTMAGVRPPMPALPPRRRPIFRGWSALGGPARFATAAAIVIVGGTLAFGPGKTLRNRVVATDGPAASRITLDRRPSRDGRLARTGTLDLSVRDIASTARKIEALVQANGGAALEPISALPAHATHRTTRLLLRVPANRLDGTMDTIAALGTVHARHIATADLAPGIDAVARQLHDAQSAQAALGQHSPGDTFDRAAVQVQVGRLSARLAAQQRRITYATLAIVLHAVDTDRADVRAIDATRIAERPMQPTQHELLPDTLRRTSIALARGSRETIGSILLWHRLVPFNFAALHALAARSRAGGVATGRNDDTDRV